MKQFLLLFSIAIMLVGCGQSDSSKEKNKNHAINLCISNHVSSLDPRIGSVRPANLLVKMMFDGLMRIEKGGVLAPGLAESYAMSEDGKTYTFSLRDSYWSNGEPLTAHDFEYAWKKSVDPSYAQPGSFTFYVIKNVKACLEGKVSTEQVGVRAIDDHTLVVDLEHPAPYFLELVACSTYAPINKKIDLQNKGWANQDGPLFTVSGPFRMKTWKKGDFLELEKNPYYWDAENVIASGIHIQVVQDEITQYYLFEKGEVDWIGDPLAPLSLDIVEKLHLEEKVAHKEAVGLYWYFLNTEVFPFTNKNMRKAFAYAIDRKEIADHVLQGKERAATGILGSKLTLQKEPYFDDGNRELARKYFNLALEELGVEREKLSRITLSYPSLNNHTRVAQAIQQQWKKAFRIEVTLEHMDKPVFFNKVRNGDYQIGSFLWVSWLYDPIYMLDTFRSRSFATNMSRWESPIYQTYLTESDHELDVEKRKEFLRKAETFLMDELPVIPICFNSITHLQSEKLKEVYITPLLEIDFKYAYSKD